MDINSLNDNGRTIFQRAIEWAAGADLPGPLAHWKLDEASGTTAVDSVGGHDGTLVSGEARAAHVIDQERCIKCGECFNACKFAAVNKL